MHEIVLNVRKMPEFSTQIPDIKLILSLSYAPNITISTPPMTGFGIVTNKAPSFPITPQSIIMSPAAMATLVFPT